MTRADELGIVPGSARSLREDAGPGPVSLRRAGNYPVEAVCAGCGGRVRRQSMKPEVFDWDHVEPAR